MLAAGLGLEPSAFRLTAGSPRPVGLPARMQWSGVRESNPRLLLGRQRHYHSDQLRKFDLALSARRAQGLPTLVARHRLGGRVWARSPDNAKQSTPSTRFWTPGVMRSTRIVKQHPAGAMPAGPPHTAKAVCGSTSSQGVFGWTFGLLLRLWSGGTPFGFRLGRRGVSGYNRSGLRAVHVICAEPSV